MQRLIVSIALVIGCQPATQVEYPALAKDCSPERIGKVSVHGASLGDVAPLSVLEGAFDDQERTDRITEVATELLHVRGYPNARIEVQRQAGCGVELDVAVALGPKFKISQLAFQTEDGFPEDERVETLADALGTVNAVGGSYVEDRMMKALDLLERRYHELGWIDAKVKNPITHYDETKGSVALVIPIEAGERYKIGAVRAHGSSSSTREEVLAVLGLRNGDWYDASLVRSRIERARKRVDRHIELRMEVSADRNTIDIEARVAGGRR
ncbi:MAG TPA: POTRA domain-containing protein [Kofleriaceae bacterium]